MLPNSLHDFLIASVGASASFIGLLFVALTVVLQRSGTSNKIEQRDRLLAESAYSALLSILFISMVGLLPGGNVSWIIMIMGIVGVLSTLRVRQHNVGELFQRLGRRGVNDGLIIGYGFMAIYGLLVVTGQLQLSRTIFYTIMFALYSIALGRAWALTGIE
jgi:hypothetical protein